MNALQQRSQIELRLKTLTNDKLKSILGHFSLPKTGVKASMQKRLIEFMTDAIQSNNLAQFDDLRYMVIHGGDAPPPNSGPHSSSRPSPAQAQMQSPYNGRPALPAPNGVRGYPGPARLSFKSSAFYKIEEALTPVTDLPDMPSNRHTIPTPVTLTNDLVERMRHNPNLKIMLYCATSTLLTNFERVDVAFPNQLEVRMNQEEVRSNYKGLKNKPGTTKPADLTDYIRKTAGYANNLSITYALTTKKFSFVVNLVRKVSADELTLRIKNGKVISRDSVLDEMRRKARDPDIEVGSIVMSLKDPISTLRLSLPCRSTLCSHNQCFDAGYFIQLQEQAPTWTCPVCNKTISYEALVIDQYVQDILQRTSGAAEKVTIEPSGEWSEIKQDDDRNRGKSQSRAPYDNDSDDDVVEYTPATRTNNIKSEFQSATPGFAQQTPPLSSREPSISNKRPSAVIDLTLSDDEDEPPRPAKRHNTAAHSASHSTGSYNTPASIPDMRASDYQSMAAPRYSQPNQTTSGFHRPELPPPQLPPPDRNGMQTTNSHGQRLPWPSGPAYSSFSPYRGSNGNYNGSNSPP